MNLCCRSVNGGLRILRYAPSKPSAGVGPVAVGSAGRNSEHLGGFIGRQPGEVAEFDQFRFLGMLGTQAVQSFVESE